MIKSRRRGSWAGYVARIGERRNAYTCRTLVGKLEGTIPPGRPRRKWLDSIKMNLRGMDWIDLAEDRDQWRTLVNTVLNLQVPLNALAT
jgi:hypothetical protein